MAYRNILPLLATLLLGFGVGWWLGSRKTTTEVVREEVRYMVRPTTNITLDFPAPTRVGRVDLPSLSYIDTIREEVRIPADTASILVDYFKQREYELDFTTDTTGIYKVKAVIYCNRLASASATIAPLQREVLNTVVKVQNFRPYIGGGIGIGKDASVGIEAGALIKAHHLPRLGYRRAGNDNYITINYGYVF